MFDAESLLQNEFFPAELPPCFGTSDLAENSRDAIQSANSFGRNYSIPIVYSGYKSETSRRKFAIPNPYHYCKVVDLLVQNDSAISAILKKSTYSLTAPTNRIPKKSQPYAKRSSSISDTKREIELAYQNNRYEIRLDINSFFDNIYTHSIAWAIHGIDQAKRSRNDTSLLGNQIDKAIRALNYDQTNGILVGNAVSRITSEILLCTVDGMIREKFPDISCCRFVDDYYIYTQDSSLIQQIISFIRIKLSQYQLSFNENKIQINESPFLYGKPWVEQIKQYIHLRPDIFLSKLIIEYDKYKDLAILKYGLKIISQSRYTSADWPAMQSRLLNLWVRFPSLSDRIISVLLGNQDLLKRLPLRQAIYSVIDEALLLSREQELIWAVWFIKVFQIPVSQSYIINVLNSGCDPAIIIMLDIINVGGQLQKKPIQSQVQSIRRCLDAADINDKGEANTLLWTSHWLLAYEATRLKWLDFPQRPFEYAKKNLFFNLLLTKNVKFYDANFSYATVKSRTRSYEYATRSELYNALNKLQKAILDRIKNPDTQHSSVRTENENSLYQDFIDILEEDETIY